MVNQPLKGAYKQYISMKQPFVCTVKLDIYNMATNVFLIRLAQARQPMEYAQLVRMFQIQ